MKRADYKAMYKDILAERNEFKRAGNVRAASDGITLEVFKESVSKLHTWPSVLEYWREMYSDFCETLGSLNDEFTSQYTVKEWAEDYFSDWKEETHRTELKSNFTPIESYKI
jgi:hypothetical protein